MTSPIPTHIIHSLLMGTACKSNTVVGMFQSSRKDSEDLTVVEQDALLVLQTLCKVLTLWATSFLYPSCPHTTTQLLAKWLLGSLPVVISCLTLNSRKNRYCVSMHLWFLTVELVAPVVWCRWQWKVEVMSSRIEISFCPLRFFRFWISFQDVPFVRSGLSVCHHDCNQVFLLDKTYFRSSLCFTKNLSWIKWVSAELHWKCEVCLHFGVSFYWSLKNFRVLHFAEGMYVSSATSFPGLYFLLCLSAAVFVVLVMCCRFNL